jgi:hypothetical protein
VNVRILQRFTLLSPLSHVGETISTTAYLVQDPIIQPDGRVEEVAVYSGNAWRGQLRDLMATYMLAHVGSPTIGLDAFHLLYAGGSIGGPQTTNLGHARAYRAAIPMIALLGGGIGNQILPGKLRVSNAYPACWETEAIVGALYGPEATEVARRTSYTEMTTEKSFSRKDDAKDDRLSGALRSEAPALAQGQLIPAEPEKPRRSEEPATQMRMTVELLIAGVTLLSHIDLLGATEVEMGCLVSGYHAFSQSPHIGGQARMGHGLVRLETSLLDLDTGEIVEPFLSVAGPAARLSERAEMAKDAYDQHLRGMYDAMLEASGADIRRMIGAAA